MLISLGCLNIESLNLIDIVYKVDADIVMMDTKIKDGKSTFQFLTDDRLKLFVNRAKDHELSAAIAGSLSVRRCIELE